MKRVENLNAPSLAGWLMAAAAGFVAFLVSKIIGGFDWTPSVFFGLVVMVGAGLFLGMPWGAKVPEAGAEAAGHGAAAAAEAAPAAVKVADVPAAAAAAAPVKAAAVAEAPVAKPAAAAKAAAADKAAPKAAAKAEKAAPKAAAAKAEKAAPKAAAVKAEAAPKAAKAEAAAKPAAKAAAPAAKAAAVADVAVAEAEGKKPAALKAPRKGVADDLKQIEGIGPALEKLCNELGIYHFDQIAKWGAAEVAWMDANLKGFRGRVTRDKWVAQAKLIGSVGLDEFLRRAKTNDY